MIMKISHIFVVIVFFGSLATSCVPVAQYHDQLNTAQIIERRVEKQQAKTRALRQELADLRTSYKMLELDNKRLVREMNEQKQKVVGLLTILSKLKGN